MPTSKTNDFRKRNQAHYYETSKRQPKSASLKRKKNVTKTTKQQYTEKEKEFNAKFNKKFTTKLQNHKHPTQQYATNIPCETYNKNTMHKNIHLKVNIITGRKSALNGFLQHTYSVWDPKQQKMLEFTNLIKNKDTKQTWTTSLANKLGRLSQGIRNIKGSNCIKFIHKEQVPKGRNVAYTRLVVDYRPGKSDVSSFGNLFFVYELDAVGPFYVSNSL